MLTSEDFKQIELIVNKLLQPVAQDVAVVKEKITNLSLQVRIMGDNQQHLSKRIDAYHADMQKSHKLLMDFFDDENKHIKKRINHIEEHLELPYVHD